MRQVCVALREGNSQFATGIYFSGEQIRQGLCAANAGIPGLDHAGYLIDPGHRGRTARFKNDNRLRIGGSHRLDELVLVFVEIERLQVHAFRFRLIPEDDCDIGRLGGGSGSSQVIAGDIGDFAGRQFGRQRAQGRTR